MRVYLMRHGEAVDASKDTRRPLTDRGKDETKKVALILKPTKIKVETVITSNKTRAIETGQIIQKELSLNAVLEQRVELSANSPVDELYRELEGSRKDLMIVGHLPFLANLVSLMLAGKQNPSIVLFKPSSVVCLERNSLGFWQLRFAITPEFRP